MPLYEYQCESCHGVTEELQKFSDPPLEECPVCGGKMNKLMSLNSFHLKGSGWYVTDYTNKNSPRSDSSSTSAKSASGSDSSSTSASGSDSSSTSASKASSSETSSDSSKTEKKSEKTTEKK
jgi:putative FmdB family regulatory protein